MTTPDFDLDFADLDIASVQPAERLREQKIQPVPDSILKIAQATRSGLPHPSKPGEIVHVGSLEMPLKRAKAFQRHMKNAGVHVDPPATMTCHITPEDATGDDTPVIVRWRASNKRQPRSS